MGWIRGLPVGGGGGGDPFINGFTGTPGSVLFVGATNHIAEDNPNLFYDDTNNRFCVGTNTSVSRVTITGVTGTTRETGLTYTGGALTNISGGELVDWTITPPNIQFNTNTQLNLQRHIYIKAPTISSSVATKQIDMATTLYIESPVLGANTTPNTIAGQGLYAIRAVGTGGFRVTISSSSVAFPAFDTCYGVNAVTGLSASHQYHAWFMGVDKSSGSTINYLLAPTSTARSDWSWVDIDNPRISCTNAGAVIDKASTLRIEAAPTAGTNMTITTRYSIECVAGLAYFGGGIVVPTGGINSDLYQTTSAIDVAFKEQLGNRWLLFDSSAKAVGAGWGVIDTDIVASLSVIAYNASGAPVDTMSVRQYGTGGYSDLVFYDSGNTLRGAVGYGNSAAAAARRRNFIGLFNNTEFTITDDTNHFFFIAPATKQIAFGTTSPTANRYFTVQQPVMTAVASPACVQLTGGAHTNINAGVTWFGLGCSFNQTIQFATGAHGAGTLRAVSIFPPTIGYVGASTATDPTTLYVASAPVAGTNATFTDAYAVFVDDGRVRIDQGVAISGAVPATLGTTGGGTGPGTAAQNQWLEITINGVKGWLAWWV